MKLPLRLISYARLSSMTAIGIQQLINR